MLSIPICLIKYNLFDEEMKHKLIVLLGLSIIFPFCKKKIALPEARHEIQSYLNEYYNNSFKITKVEPDYNPDLFHEQWGYKAWLVDSAGITFGPVFFEYNKYQKGWITYGGSNIRKQYEEAKSNSNDNYK